ncbi:MAG TPA: alpha-amylase family glycosyl hydrolase [Thermodesulfovibrionales bacterium]|nr:alpha-amylase family glycosyl hydrolase [Thermodesulfovibrionales bacterium]
MKPWSKHPLIYEINTWVWLNELSLKHNRSVTLATVPPEEWASLFSIGVDAIWFMGVWERSPKGIQVALNNEGLMSEFRRVLPDLQTQDIVGSPYCVRRYVVDDRLGGPGGLAAARNILRERGLRLILDFVPNHVAPDHPWVKEHPKYFVRGNADDVRREPASFLEAGGNIFACGKDPYFPAWPDVLQLNAFDCDLRQAIIDTVSVIAGQCDGIRCDMAMLVMNNIFERTWGSRAGQRPDHDYWPTVTNAIKWRYPEFRFIAEAYWDLEWELQQQGFDFCYDKRLYDRMEHAESVRMHLLADLAYQEKLVRFIENHDEPRAASIFSPQQERAAAVTIATIPGAKLFHEGQFEGRKVRLPVFLGRSPVEPVDADLQSFYRRLLKAASVEGLREGRWQLCERNGWPDNASYQNLVAWCWRNGGERYLIVVNLSDLASQGQVALPWDELKGKTWRLTDVLSDETFDRNGDEMFGPGLYVDLGPWKYHFFRLNPL